MVLIGLGSNQGQSTQILVAALRELERFAQPGTFVASSLWRTSPVDCPPGSDPFINAVAGFSPCEELTPEDLLQDLKALERKYGRRDVVVRNAPRELDLDLLVFGAERRNTQTFTLPHPRAVDRLFVLAPAAEIAPGLRWPGLDKSISELLEALETDEQVTPLADLSIGA